MSNEWINVTDRLPEISKKDEWSNKNGHSDTVLVVEQGKIYFGVYIKQDRFKTWLVSGRSGNIQVTHWMPLPEPPKPATT